MRKFTLITALIIAAVIVGVVLLNRNKTNERVVSANTDLLPNFITDDSGFKRAVGPYAWNFPEDHGPHLGFQTEWWYYTGNLSTEAGRRFGYQFTIFRRAITPDSVTSESEWRSNQLYLAHFTVTDVEGRQFYQAQRFSRASADLAGATTDPRYRVWLEDWEIRALDQEASQTHLTAGTDTFEINLTLNQAKPPALQGDRGLSPKSDVTDNASYYYSLSRLITEGTMTINHEMYQVRGTTWMDHEFSTSALGADAQGWDWFGLHLDDNRELMLGQIRLTDGGIDPVFGGLLVFPDGSTHQLAAGDFTIEITDTWTSPHTGTTYPAGWDIVIHEPEPLHLVLTPLLSDQELTEGIVYWEGAVQIGGDITGYGYAELTGYQGSMRQRF